MKMPSLRFNVRRVVIALVIVSLIVVLEIGRRKRSVLLEKASEHSSSEELFLTLARLTEKSPPPRKPDLSKIDVKNQGPITDFIDEDPEKLAEEQKVKVAAFRKKAAFFSLLREKYERAALFPWLPVGPDPVEPK
jgi:hypothetical protein